MIVIGGYFKVDRGSEIVQKYEVTWYVRHISIEDEEILLLLQNFFGDLILVILLILV